jgi:hypothetical protein
MVDGILLDKRLPWGIIVHDHEECVFKGGHCFILGDDLSGVWEVHWSQKSANVERTL